MLMLDPEIDLENIKVALKIDTDDDDLEVKRAVRSAIAYVRGAVGKDKPSFYTSLDDDDMEQLNTAILMMSDHYYKARSATIESSNAYGSLREYDLGFTSILLQIKASYLSYKESEEDGG